MSVQDPEFYSFSALTLICFENQQESGKSCRIDTGPSSVVLEGALLTEGLEAPRRQPKARSLCTWDDEFFCTALLKSEFCLKTIYGRQCIATKASRFPRKVEPIRKIGYKNPQHFSTAFKKRYGIPPKNFRQK